MRSRRARDSEPVTFDERVDWHARPSEIRQDARCNPTFAYVDQHHPNCKADTLRSKRIRPTGIATAHRPNIHPTPQLTNDQSPDQRSEQVSKKGFEGEFEHMAIVME